MAYFLQTVIGHQILMDQKRWLKMNTPKIHKLSGEKISLINKWKRIHPGENYRDHLDQVYSYEFPLCKCLCGEKVINIKNSYIKGHNRPWQGKKRGPMKDSTKAKQREGHLGKKYNMTEKGSESSRQNAKCMRTPEAIAKMRKTLTGRKLTKEHIKNAMRRRIPTSLETKMIKVIEKLNLPYKYTGNGAMIIDNMNPDFVNINGEKIAIEVYAKFYKTIDGAKIEDWKKDRSIRFSEYGWNVYYFDETQVNETYIKSVLGSN